MGGGRKGAGGEREGEGGGREYPLSTPHPSLIESRRIFVEWLPHRHNLY